MSGTHPLLDVDNISNLALRLNNVIRDSFVGLRLVSPLEIAPKVLKKCHFLLECRWVFEHRVLFAYILTVNCSSLHVVEVEAVGVQHNLGSVVEEHSCRLVAKMIAKAVFA